MLSKINVLKLIFTRLLAILFISVSMSGNAFAQEPINTLEKSGFFSYKPSGVAIRGTDTVAYFTEGKPVEGSDEFTTMWGGAKWKFSSQKHLDLFVGNPDKYAPQYGGYCAYGVAIGNLVKIEPELWKIIEGKLYLNYNEDLQNEWEKDIPGYISKADANFDDLIGK